MKVIRKNHIENYVELWADPGSDWSFAPEEEFLNNVNEWVRENELGHRLSYNGWKLRGPASVTAFYLKWNSED